LTKPVSLEKLEILIKRALQEKSLTKENTALHQRLDQQYGFQNIVGHSKALLNVLEQVKQVAASRATVLVLGETGTGKELVAQMIHQNSRGRGGRSWRRIARAIPAGCWRASCSGMRKGRSRGRRRRGSDGSRRRTTARCF